MGGRTERRRVSLNTWWRVKVGRREEHSPLLGNSCCPAPTCTPNMHQLCPPQLHLQAAALGAAEWVHTCRHSTDDFGELVELDVVIALKLQQHHLQVHVVTHLKLPHSPACLLVQGCCRGNVAEDTEMGQNEGRQPELNILKPCEIRCFHTDP